MILPEDDPIRSGLTSGIAALLASSLLAYPLYRLLLAIKSRQTVSEYLPGHEGKQGTPTMGGLIIWFGFGVGLAFGQNGGELLGLWLVLSVFAAIGFLDDFVIPRLRPGKRGLGWMQKLALQALVPVAWGAIVVALGGVSLTAALFLVFLILFYVNAFNFTDGLDGLAGYVALAWLAGIIALPFVGHHSSSSFVIACALAGAFIPFLVLNTKPAKVFMGDVGSLPIGATLGFLLLMAFPWASDSPLNSKFDLAFHWELSLVFFLMSFVMLIELVPVPLQILSVKLRKKRLFPMTPIHHALEKSGWSEVRIVTVFVIIQIACSGAAICLVASWYGAGS